MECAGKMSGSKVPKITKVFNGHEQSLGWCTNSINLFSSSHNSSSLLTAHSGVLGKRSVIFWDLSLPSLMVDKSVPFLLYDSCILAKYLPGLAPYCI